MGAEPEQRIRYEIVKRKQQGNTTEFTSEVYIDNKPVAVGIRPLQEESRAAAAEKSLVALNIG